jgi:ribosomal protein S18 acetylase RimI-like enzyme
MTIIRKAISKDAEAIATLLLLAMEDIVYGFIGEKDPKKAKAFLLHFAQQKNNQYSYQNCWVAAEEKEVVAAVNVYDGAQLSALRQPVLEHLKNQYNRHLEPEDETSSGEYYIDTFGVSPHQQGKGIGANLLQFLIDEYVNKQGQTLGLLVAEENPNAKRLYLKMGFKSAGSKVLLGKQMEHLQIKR